MTYGKNIGTENFQKHVLTYFMHRLTNKMLKELQVRCSYILKIVFCYFVCLDIKGCKHDIKREKKQKLYTKSCCSNFLLTFSWKFKVLFFFFYNKQQHKKSWYGIFATVSF